MGKKKSKSQINERVCLIYRSDLGCHKVSSMSDDESPYKPRDPRLKKRDSGGDFPPPPGTLDRSTDELYPPGEGPLRPSRRSRSRSRSPDGRSRRREYYSGSRKSSAGDDGWKNKTDAFLQNLGAA